MIKNKAVGHKLTSPTCNTTHAEKWQFSKYFDNTVSILKHSWYNLICSSKRHKEEKLTTNSNASRHMDTQQEVNDNIIFTLTVISFHWLWRGQSLDTQASAIFSSFIYSLQSYSGQNTTNQFVIASYNIVDGELDAVIIKAIWTLQKINEDLFHPVGTNEMKTNWCSKIIKIKFNPLQACT